LDLWPADLRRWRSGLENNNIKTLLVILAILLWILAVSVFAPETSGKDQVLQYYYSDLFVAPGSISSVTGGVITTISSQYIVSYGVVEPEKNPNIYVEYLRKLAGKDFEVLNCIATKESKWRMVWNYMYKTDPKKYTAYGFFQILESTARGIDPTLDRTDPYENIELAVKIFNKSGVFPWLVWEQCYPLN